MSATTTQSYHQLDSLQRKQIDLFNAEVAEALGNTPIPQDEDRSIFNTSIYAEMSDAEKRQLHADLFNAEVEEFLAKQPATLQEPTLPTPLQTFEWCAGNDEGNPLAASLFPMEFPAGMEYVITSKHSLDFECEEAQNEEDGDTNFADFARRKSATRIHEFHPTKDSYRASRCFEDRPHDRFLFVFDRTGKLVDGAY